MTKKISGYQVTNSDESQISDMIGFEKALHLAYNNYHTCFNHIDRMYNGHKEYIVMVTPTAIDLCNVKQTDHEKTIARKFAKLLKLKIINERIPNK